MLDNDGFKCIVCNYSKGTYAYSVIISSIHSPYVQKKSEDFLSHLRVDQPTHVWCLRLALDQGCHQTFGNKKYTALAKPCHKRVMAVVVTSYVH